MSFPEFTTYQKLTDAKQTTLQSVIRAINDLVSNLRDIFTSLLKKVQLDSTVLKNIQLQANQTTTIPHTLGRTLSGWQIIRKRGNAAVWDVQDSNPNPQTYLQLVSNQAISIDLLVF